MTIQLINDPDHSVCAYGKHIYFRNLGNLVGGKQRKTNRYEVNALDGTYLGIIHWFGRWRQYVFEPYQSTVYAASCMQDIAEFIEVATKAHRTKKKAAKA